MRAARTAAAVVGGGVAAVGALELFTGPFPFALSVLPSAEDDAYCVALPVHVLAPGMVQRRAASNYAKVDEDAARAQLLRVVQVGSASIPARLLGLRDVREEQPAPAEQPPPRGVMASSAQGVAVRAWATVQEPRWVGDEHLMVLSVSPRCGLDKPVQRYASLCLLRQCAEGMCAPAGSQSHAQGGRPGPYRLAP